jgi:hypothetical protein
MRRAARLHELVVLLRDQPCMHKCCHCIERRRALHGWAPLLGSGFRVQGVPTHPCSCSLSRGRRLGRPARATCGQGMGPTQEICNKWGHQG